MTFYTELSQIGLSAGCTVEDVIQKMANNSQAQLATNDNMLLIEGTPTKWGTLLVVKHSINRIVMLFANNQVGYAALYFAAYNNNPGRWSWNLLTATAV